MLRIHPPAIVFQYCIFLGLCCFLTSCATTTPLKSMEASAVIPRVCTHTAQGLSISLFSMIGSDPERKQLYTEYAQNGYLPLQIEIVNTTEHRFTLKQTQYAICNPAYERTRRVEADSMALAKVRVIAHGAADTPSGIFARWKEKWQDRKVRKGFEKIEFDEKTIPAHATLTGWLYFKMPRSNNSQTFFQQLHGYELEIACVKNLDTNVVNNFYLELDPFISEALP